jgi:hypothetical protein
MIRDICDWHRDKVSKSMDLAEKAMEELHPNREYLCRRALRPS